MAKSKPTPEFSPPSPDDLMEVKTSLSSFSSLVPQTYKIKTEAQYIESATILKRLKDFKGLIDEKLGIPRRKAKDLYDHLNKLYTDAMNGPKRMEAAVKAERIAFEERKAAAALAARKKAEADLKAAEKSGDDHAVAVAERKFDRVSVAPVLPAAGTAGISNRKSWKADVTDMKAFAKACVEGIDGLSVEMLLPAAPALTAYAKLTAVAQTKHGLRVYESISQATL